MDRDEWTMNMKRYRSTWPKNPPPKDVDEAWYEIISGFSFGEMDRAITNLAKFRPFAPSVAEIVEEAGKVASEMRPKSRTVKLADGYPETVTAYGKAWSRLIPLLKLGLGKNVITRKYTDDLRVRFDAMLPRDGDATEAMVTAVEEERRKLRATLVAAGALES